MDAMRLSSPQLPAVALNTNSNVPLRSLSRVHRQCHHPFYSLPSIPPPPPPLSDFPPNYSPWLSVLVRTKTMTSSIHPSIFPITTPPLPPPFQSTPLPPPMILNPF